MNIPSSLPPPDTPRQPARRPSGYPVLTRPQRRLHEMMVTLFAEARQQHTSTMIKNTSEVVVVEPDEEDALAAA